MDLITSVAQLATKANGIEDDSELMAVESSDSLLRPWREIVGGKRTGER